MLHVKRFTRTQVHHVGANHFIEHTLLLALLCVPMQINSFTGIGMAFYALMQRRQAGTGSLLV